MQDDTDHYQALFLGDVPLMDVRAPVEYAKGAFPHAVSLPLMTDAERHEVGICYKAHGQEAALQLGHQLVAGATRHERLEGWLAFARANPEGYLYCFRGGLRSRIVQRWLLDEAGLRYGRVLGGYKAMRAYLLEVTQRAAAQCRFVVLGGMTGTGKTDVLLKLDHALDLEGFAHHRGSSFGKHATAQPAQIDFEHRLAIQLLKKRMAGHRMLVLEDESRSIGSCHIPPELYQAMQSGPLVWLEDSLDNRVQRILRDYVVFLGAEFAALYGPQQGFELFARQLRQSLANITRRLGDERHSRLRAMMDAALTEHGRRGELGLHTEWIKGLLTEYYDPMYSYQREKKSARIVFSGDHEAVLAYLQAASLEPEGLCESGLRLAS